MNYPTFSISQPTYPLKLVATTGGEVQISIHAPSPFICANRPRVIPDWRAANLWVVIVLQQSRYELVTTTPEVEAEKQRLREKFMRFGCDVAFNLRDSGYLTDVIDPRTGYPLLSRPGQIPHDDTAVVKALLGYPIIHNKCRVLVHPQWGMAVYPSVLISAAHPTMIEFVTKNIAPKHGWNEEER